MRIRREPRTLPWGPSRVKVFPGHLGRAVARRLIYNARFLLDDPGARPAWARGLPEVPFVEAIPTANSSLLTRFVGDVADDDLPQIPTAASSLPEVTAFIRAYHAAAIAWLTAADAAGAITPADVQCAISDATVGYAFGDFELICVDSLATPVQRATTDALLARFLKTVPWGAHPVAYVAAEPGRARRNIRAGEPSLSDYQWEIASQSPREMWIAYDPVNPEIFVPNPEVAIVSTCEVYGDDAGDFEVNHRAALIREDLRVYEITSTDDAAALISRYPIRLAGDPQLYDEWAGLEAPIDYVIDWEALARDWDGVRLGVPAALEVGYVPLRIRAAAGEGTGMITGWTPGSTLYVRDPVTR